MSERLSPVDRRRWPRLMGLAGGCLTASALLMGSLTAHALPAGWVHDHSSAGIPARPNGYSAIVARFGQPCNSLANSARSFWPSQSARNVSGYITYHPYIDRDVSWNVRDHIEFDRRDGAVDYGVYGYNCRYISGSTSWSTHAFGAAVDTNSARNPQGNSTWNGVGADGVNYGKYIPNMWKGPFPGHNFYWGKNFSTTPDPMHFQYATGY